MIRFERACPEDAARLAEVQKRAFDSQVFEEMPDLGGPPGYDSPAWQVATMHETSYLKILEDGTVIGGIVLRIPEPDHCHVERIFLDPPCHRRGIGTQAFAWLEQTYPHYRLWTLRTPAFTLSNQRLYERLGYRRTGEKEILPGFVLIEYEKRIGG